jgi:general secretion pathway protein D
VRDYLGAAAPLPPAGMPGSIEDPRIAVPTQPAAGAAIRRKRRH